MSTPLVLKYPIDPTGTNPANLVQGEVQTLIPRPIRAAATDYGAFYSASLIVTDTANNTILTSAQYYPAEMYKIPTEMYGKEVCAIIIITDPTVSNSISLQYQAVGGIFSTSTEAIVQMLNAAQLDNRPITWPNIEQKPTEFVPTLHTHSTDDFYGMEYVTFALERVRQAILQGDDVSHDQIYAYIDKNIAAVSAAQVSAINAAMALHLAAANPHPQYVLIADENIYPLVRTPTNEVPVSGAIGVNPELTLTGNEYYSLYGVSQGASEFRLSVNAGCVSPFIFDAVLGAVNTYNYSGVLSSETVYYWQVRYQDSEGVWSAWSTVTSFTSAVIGVNTPIINSITNGAVGVSLTPILTNSAFSSTGIVDTQTSSVFQIWTNNSAIGVPVWSDTVNSGNLNSVSVSGGTLQITTTYYARSQQVGALLGASNWSSWVAFTTASTGITTPSIITPANDAIDVSITPTITASAFTPFGGTDTQASTNWEIWTLGSTLTPVVRTFTASGTFTPPSDVMSVTSVSGYGAAAVANTTTPVTYTSGAASTAFGFAFPGGVNATAPVTTTENTVAVIPGYSYPIIVPTGGIVTINYSTIVPALVWSSENDTTKHTSITLPVNSIVADTLYQIRVQYTGVLYGSSAWSAWSYFTAGSQGVNTPSITSPVIDSTGVSTSPTLLASAFSVFGGADTQASASWEIWTAGTAVPHTQAFTANGTWTAPTGVSNLTSIIGHGAASTPISGIIGYGPSYYQIGYNSLIGGYNYTSTPTITQTSGSIQSGAGGGVTILPLYSYTSPIAVVHGTVPDGTYTAIGTNISANDVTSPVMTAVVSGNIVTSVTVTPGLTIEGSQEDAFALWNITFDIGNYLQGFASANVNTGTYYATATIAQGVANSATAITYQVSGGGGSTFTISSTPVLTAGNAEYGTVGYTAGANATAVGNTFLGATGSAAPVVVTDTNVAVVPGTSYPIVVPTGASVTINWSTGTAGALAWSAEGDTADKTSITVPSGTLSSLSSYVARVKYTGNMYGTSAWSTWDGFTTGNEGVNTPTIISPANSSSVSTSTLTLTGSTFSAYGTTDTHASTNWELWSVATTPVLLWSYELDTVNLTSITVPSSYLTDGVSYQARIQYTGAAAGSSEWSAWDVFTMAWPVGPTVIGESWGGGYFMGNVTVGAANTAIILAPKTSGEHSGEILYTSNGPSPSGAYSTTDSVADTAAWASLGAGSPAAIFVSALTIGGYSDWQIPSSAVWDLVTANANPTTTTSALYITGGQEVIENAWYWSSTAYDDISTNSVYVNAVPAVAAHTIPATAAIPSYTTGAAPSYTIPAVPSTPSSPGTPIYQTISGGTGFFSMSETGNTLPSNYGQCPAGQALLSEYDQTSTDHGWVWSCQIQDRVITGYVPGTAVAQIPAVPAVFVPAVPGTVHPAVPAQPAQYIAATPAVPGHWDTSTYTTYDAYAFNYSNSTMQLPKPTNTALYVRAVRLVPVGS